MYSITNQHYLFKIVFISQQIELIISSLPENIYFLKRKTNEIKMKKFLIHSVIPKYENSMSQN